MSCVVALSGGIGGAKLALGLARVLPADELVIVANTGDDFEHLGLRISPDIDTLIYTLADVANPETGWGRRDETWSFMQALGEVGGETWFRLGDRDLATHVERTRRLWAGETLSEVTADLARRLGVRPTILPMSDDTVSTRVGTEEGWLDFQDYFVRLQCRPVVREIAFQGAATAKAQPDFLEVLRRPDLRAVVICPSNPFISVEPILSLPGVSDALMRCAAPVLAVSPIIGGRAVKGPTAKMMAELGLDVTAAAVARRYGTLLDGYILDHADADLAIEIEASVFLAETMMTTLEHREVLARTVLAAADELRA